MVTLNLQQNYSNLSLSFYTHLHLPTGYSYTSFYIIRTITHKTVYLLCHGICLLLVLCGSLIRLPHLRHKIIHRPTQKPAVEGESARRERKNR